MHSCASHAARATARTISTRHNVVGVHTDTQWLVVVVLYVVL